MAVPTVQEIQEYQEKLSHMKQVLWTHHDVGSGQWWLLLVLLIIPWVFWWFLVDRTRIKQIWLYGCLMAILIIILDDIGTELDLWYYPYQLLRFIPGLNPVDFSILPVFHMLLYQYFTQWKPFIIANIITAIFFAFVAEPIYVWLHIYEIVHWRYIYSFPIYVIKSMCLKGMLEGVLKIKTNEETEA